MEDTESLDSECEFWNRIGRAMTRPLTACRRQCSQNSFLGEACHAYVQCANFLCALAFDLPGLRGANAALKHCADPNGGSRRRNPLSLRRLQCRSYAGYEAAGVTTLEHDVFSSRSCWRASAGNGCAPSSKERQRLATDTGGESVRHLARHQIDDVDAAVTLASDKKRVVAKGAIHRLLADRECRLLGE
jgi:hypothetical protein